MSFVATCHKLKINTWKDVLQRIQSHPASQLHELLPDRWQHIQTEGAMSICKDNSNNLILEKICN
jgi:hypothetical protein